MLIGRTGLTTAAMMLAAALAVALSQAAAAETVLRIGMTAGDIPRTLGQPDQGFEGNRFTGLTMYDALTMWDLSSADKASVLIAGLATEWKVNDADKTKWIFKLRSGVTFHKGCFGYWPMENVELHAARAARARQERQILGQGAHSACRKDGAAADA